ncbi:hypothetical protein [Brachyspira hampsonii]|uniref:hypothetical protein n=1 Tax=Brachyspira hampsonii TaxID=1287055 RepID=UPI0003492BA1|nr:hypothetical protein [Brachyspira hampsonii]
MFLDTIASNMTTIDWFNSIDNISPDLVFFVGKNPYNQLYLGYYRNNKRKI